MTLSFLNRYYETHTLADGQDMRGHLLSQKKSRRLWRLKCKQVLNLKVPCYKFYEVKNFF